MTMAKFPEPFAFTVTPPVSVRFPPSASMMLPPLLAESVPPLTVRVPPLIQTWTVPLSVIVQLSSVVVPPVRAMP